MDKDKEERIKKLEEEISLYHEQANIQNKQIEHSIEVRNFFNKGLRKGMFVWAIMIVLTIIVVASNFDLLKGLQIKDIAFDAFNIAIGSFLASNSLAFIFTALIGSGSGYSKSRIAIFSLIILLFSIILVFSGIAHISQLPHT